MFDPLTLLTSLIPIASQGGKVVLDIVKNKFAPDSVKPSNVGEFIQLQQAQIAFYNALNLSSGSSYPWVAAIRDLMRPFVVVVVMMAWVAVHLSGSDTVGVDNAAASVGFYLFADRTLFKMRGI